MDRHDEKNFNLLSQLINKDAVLVDVGAHRGLYTFFFLDQLDSDKGQIYTIELNPETFKVLEARFSYKPNVTLINKAICDSDGTIEYYVGDTTHQTNIIGHDMGNNKNDVGGTVESIRLDTLLKDEKEITVLKIDVEGAEIAVLKGAEGIMSRVNHILLECHLDEDWPEVRELIIGKYGFSCYNMETNGIVNASTQQRPYQCFCTNKDIVQHIVKN